MIPTVRSSFDVALWLWGRMHAAREPFNAMKLQNILYLAQAAWSIQHDGAKLMPATFLATRAGPIEPTIYHAFENGAPRLRVRPPSCSCKRSGIVSAGRELTFSLRSQARIRITDVPLLASATAKSYLTQLRKFRQSKRASRPSPISPRHPANAPRSGCRARPGVAASQGTGARIPSPMILETRPPNSRCAVPAVRRRRKPDRRRGERISTTQWSPRARSARARRADRDAV